MAKTRTYHPAAIDRQRPDPACTPCAAAPKAPAPAGAGIVMPHTLASVPIQLRASAVREASPRLAPPRAGGRQLPRFVRERMESSMNADFSGVRVHESDNAAAIGAVAYAQGNTLHFQPGAYDPHSSEGLRLLGHELAHVVQQREGRVAIPGGGGLPINDAAHLEHEADAMATNAVSGRMPARGAAPSGSAATSSVATSSAPASSAPMQPVWVRVRSTGKVLTDWVTPKDGTKKGWIWMEEQDFVRFKNTGKRTSSSKWTRKSESDEKKSLGVGEPYFMNPDDNNFYDDRKYKRKSKPQPKKKELLDRSREELGTKDHIRNFDVLSYREAKKLKDGKFNRDHIPSGQSLKLKAKSEGENQKEAYEGGLTIAIPTEHHRYYSPTYGGRNSKKDEVPIVEDSDSDSSSEEGTETMKRSEFDSTHPGTGFYRDSFTMLDQTRSEFTGSQRLEQLGGYRYHFRENVRNETIDPTEKFLELENDPLEKGGQIAKETDDSVGLRQSKLFMGELSDYFNSQSKTKVKSKSNVKSNTTTTPKKKSSVKSNTTTPKKKSMKRKKSTSNVVDPSNKKRKTSKK